MDLENNLNLELVRANTFEEERTSKFTKLQNNLLKQDVNKTSVLIFVTFMQLI